MTHPTPLRRAQRIRGSFLRNRMAVLSLIVLILLVLTALAGQHLLALLEVT